MAVGSFSPTPIEKGVSLCMYILFLTCRNARNTTYCAPGYNFISWNRDFTVFLSVRSLKSGQGVSCQFLFIAVDIL